MSGVMPESFLQEFVTWALSLLPGTTDSFGPAATMMHPAIINGHRACCLVLMFIHILRFTVPSETISALFGRSKFIRSSVACAYGFANIWITFGNLLMIDERYISMAIIFIIMWIFIVAMFLTVVVSPNPKGHLKHDGNDNANRKADDGIITTSKAGARKEGEVGEEDDEETKGHTGKKESSDVEYHTGRKKLRGEEIEEEEEGGGGGGEEIEEEERREVGVEEVRGEEGEEIKGGERGEVGVEEVRGEGDEEGEEIQEEERGEVGVEEVSGEEEEDGEEIEEKERGEDGVEEVRGEDEEREEIQEEERGEVGVKEVRGEEEEEEERGEVGVEEVRGEEEEKEVSSGISAGLEVSSRRRKSYPFMRKTYGYPLMRKTYGDKDHVGRKKGEEKERGEVGVEEEQQASSSHDKFPLSNITEVEIKGDHTGKKESKLAGGVEEKRTPPSALWIFRLPCMLLCLMRYFSDMEMEMTNCLLFLSCSLGELTLMMARLCDHSEDIQLQPALEVVQRAFLVMGLLTAHTMAAELLGEGVVLVCMPELAAALVLLTIYLGSDDDDTAASAVRTVEAVVRTSDRPLIFFSAVTIGFLVVITFTDTDIDEAEGAMFDLVLSIVSSIIVVVLFSLILPQVCIFVLWSWCSQSIEFRWSIRLLRLCHYGPWTAAVLTIIIAKRFDSLLSTFFVS